MQLTTIATFAALAGLSAAGASRKVARTFGVPTDGGFPSPNQAQLAVINSQADGTLSNGAPPAKLADSSLTGFQVVAMQETFEVAFFASLIQNITTNVPGYEINDQGKKDELVDILEAVLAQEQLHAINAINILKKFNKLVPQPCQYTFPVTNVHDAIQLAETFTSVVLGTLQDFAQILAKNGDDGAVRSLTSSLGQEGEQNGFYRILLARKPSEKPFLTTSTLQFAFSVLQDFIVDGSCPFNVADIPVKVFPALNILTGKGGQDVDARDQYLTYSADLADVAEAAKYVGGNGAGLFVTIFSGQRVPRSEPIQNAKWNGKQVTFEAFFPYTEEVLDALSIHTLTIGSNFTSPAAVVNATIAAPGLAQVYDHVKAWDGVM
ncbi:hypothetical protein GQ53DRAFT_746623 [Thozetella sp. PMI_491]|nr:hypothetical protein GQ53DRAFT_746623 [Thozetella sp. PMI_491]